MNNPLVIDTTGFIFKPKPVKFRLFCFIARIVASGQAYGQSGHKRLQRVRRPSQPRADQLETLSLVEVTGPAPLRLARSAHLQPAPAPLHALLFGALEQRSTDAARPHAGIDVEFVYDAESAAGLDRATGTQADETHCFTVRVKGEEHDVVAALHRFIDERERLLIVAVDLSAGLNYGDCSRRPAAWGAVHVRPAQNET